MSNADELRAALAVAELEDQLVAAKDSGDTGNDDYRTLKDQLRDARRAYREQRSGTPAEGDAVASPEPVQTTAEVKQK